MSKSMKELAGSLSKSTRSASSELRNGLVSIREYVRNIQAQIEAIKAIPPLQETAVERMEAWIDEQSRISRSHAIGISPFMSPGRYEEPSTFYLKYEHVAFAYLAPTIKQCLREEIGQAYATVQGISDYDREQQIEKLEVQLFDGELTEESIIRDAERAGFQLPRRGNADPRAVLAADKDLP